MEYLGHIASHDGVKVDPSKIKAIKEWKIPTSIKHLRGFLGLTGYYRKFVKDYERIVATLTTLLKKDAFSWTLEATKAFEHLKEEMCQTPVLATPDFTNTFIVECDASGNGIGVVLMQDERPIAFESRPIKGKFLHNAIYEKEMLAILHALKKWRLYQMGRLFKDEDVEALFCAISIIQLDWINEVRDEWKKDEEVWPLIQKLQKIPIQTILPEIEEEGKIILEPRAVTKIRT